MLLLPLALLVTTIGADPQIASRPGLSTTPQEVQRAVERSLPFLLKGSLAWREDRKCVTCHQIPMTIWSHNEAKARGLTVDRENLDHLTDWACQFCATDKYKGELTGGFLSTMGQMIMAQEKAPRSKKVAATFEVFEPIIARMQRPDGSWKEGNQISVKGVAREADEVDTMWIILALTSLERRGDGLTEKERMSQTRNRTRALAWLKESKVGTRTDWLALRMLVEHALGDKGRAEGMRKELQARQNPDGGWGFFKESESYPHTTGECLYALSLMGVPPVSSSVRSGCKYLLGTQRPDGSWKALSRQDLGAGKPVRATKISIHWGTAWATIGLLQSLPNR